MSPYHHLYLLPPTCHYLYLPLPATACHYPPATSCHILPLPASFCHSLYPLHASFSHSLLAITCQYLPALPATTCHYLPLFPPAAAAANKISFEKGPRANGVLSYTRAARASAPKGLQFGDRVCCCCCSSFGCR